MFRKVLTDKITLIKKNGEKYEDIDANVQKEQIFVFDEKIPFEEGELIERKLSSGVTERFRILDKGFQTIPDDLKKDVPNHYQLKVKKEGVPNEIEKNQIQNYFYGNVNNSALQQQTQNSQQNVKFSQEDIKELDKIKDEISELKLGEKEDGFRKELEELRRGLNEGKSQRKVNSLSKNLISILKESSPTLLAQGAIEVLKRFLT